MHAAAQTQPRWPEGVKLLLGIGAQKAGTTWVHGLLRGHPDCVAAPLKEVHYFDTIALGNRVGMRKVRQKVDRLHRAGGHQRMIRRLARLAEIMVSPDDTHQSYVDLMTADAKPGQVVLDVTPSSVILSDETVQDMASLGDTRFLLILREPVSRIWSNIRMAVARQAGDSTGFEQLCQQRLDGVLADGQGPEFKRGDYAEGLRKLDTHVPRDRRLVLFFETRFSQETADRITAFLGIPAQPLGDLGVRNEGLKAAMRPDQIARLTEALRPQYDAVCAAFGTEVPASWHARFARSEVCA